MTLLDHPLISSRYFFPRRQMLKSPHVIKAKDAELHCHFQRNQNPKTVLFFHGNGEVVADYGQPYADWFNAMGADLFIAEYRGYGGSTGTPALAAMLDDVPLFVDAPSPK